MSLRLFVNEDTSAFIRGFNFPEAIRSFSGIENGIEVKRGDSKSLAVQWGTPFGTARGLGTPLVLKFGCKVPGDLDGSYVVSNYDSGTGLFAYTLSGSGATALYTLTPSWNTAKLNNLLGYDPQGFAEVTEVRCVADVASSLDGTYFVLHDRAGTVGVWIDVGNGGGTAPAGALACARQIEFNSFAANASATTIATALAALLEADPQFTATAAGPLVTVTDAAIGARTAATDGDTGFALSRWIAGSAPGTMANAPYVDLAGEIKVSENGTVSSTLTFPVRVFFDLNNSGGNPTIADPDYPPPGEILTNRYDLTRLTGGTATDLDAVDVAALPVGAVLALYLASEGVLSYWRLTAAVAITSSSVANPTVITAPGHGLPAGPTAITIGGHTGSTPAVDGNRTATYVNANTFTVPLNVTVAGAGGYFTPAENTAAGIVRADGSNAKYWTRVG